MNNSSSCDIIDLQSELYTLKYLSSMLILCGVRCSTETRQLTNINRIFYILRV